MGDEQPDVGQAAPRLRGSPRSPGRGWWTAGASRRRAAGPARPRGRSARGRRRRARRGGGRCGGRHRRGRGRAPSGRACMVSRSTPSRSAFSLTVIRSMPKVSTTPSRISAPATTMSARSGSRPATAAPIGRGAGLGQRVDDVVELGRVNSKQLKVRSSASARPPVPPLGVDDPATAWMVPEEPMATSKPSRATSRLNTARRRADVVPARA